MTPRQFLIPIFLASNVSIASECRCLDRTATEAIESKYIAAECPNVIDDPEFAGESAPLWFNSIPIESLYGLLGLFSGRQVCLSSDVQGNVYVRTPRDGVPWTATARNIADIHGYKIWISKEYIYVAK